MYIYVYVYVYVYVDTYTYTYMYASIQRSRTTPRVDTPELYLAGITQQLCQCAF